jgi:hypothetical protein
MNKYPFQSNCKSNLTILNKTMNIKYVFLMQSSVVINNFTIKSLTLVPLGALLPGALMGYRMSERPGGSEASKMQLFSVSGFKPRPHGLRPCPLRAFFF